MERASADSTWSGAAVAGLEETLQELPMKMMESVLAQQQLHWQLSEARRHPEE
jgi:hypothetical protein